MVPPASTPDRRKTGPTPVAHLRPPVDGVRGPGPAVLVRRPTRLTGVALTRLQGLDLLVRPRDGPVGRPVVPLPQEEVAPVVPHEEAGPGAPQGDARVEDGVPLRRDGRDAHVETDAAARPEDAVGGPLVAPDDDAPHVPGVLPLAARRVPAVAEPLVGPQVRERVEGGLVHRPEALGGVVVRPGPEDDALTEEVATEPVVVAPPLPRHAVPGPVVPRRHAPRDEPPEEDGPVPHAVLEVAPHGGRREAPRVGDGEVGVAVLVVAAPPVVRDDVARPVLVVAPAQAAEAVRGPEGAEVLEVQKGGEGPGRLGPDV